MKSSPKLREVMQALEAEMVLDQLFWTFNDHRFQQKINDSLSQKNKMLFMSLTNEYNQWRQTFRQRGM